MSSEASTGSFSDQLHDLWRTRPVRLPKQGPIAGVAAGIGHRYQVDPVLVRIAFVISSVFGGAGIILYLAGWLLLSKPGDQVSPAESLLGRGRTSQSRTKTVVLVVALVIALSTGDLVYQGPFGVGMSGSVFISFALMLGGLWLLYQRQPVPPPLPASVTQTIAGYPVAPLHTAQAGAYPPPAYSPYTTLPDHYEPSPDPGSPDNAGRSRHSQADPTPPAWDPLGVAPFAWDLPEPAAPPEPPVERPRHRVRFTSVILGNAVLAAAAAAAVSSAVGSDYLTPARIGAISLAVIGVGLVLGAFLRRGYGLLVVTFPLLGFVVLASIAGPLDWDESKFGEHVWAPTSMSGLADVYEGTAGDFTLDLTRLDLTENREVRIDGKFGKYSVIVPENMNVRSDCSVSVGEASCIGAGHVDGGRDGADGPILTVKMDNKFGEVSVERG
ncbi:PspC domain-containing protein [Rhodococcus xishaensis]|uniref:PspC domain-containing protein n=1 Tax=Rhodococcus xishaensis TaxID=2487364 RepID=A0A438B2F8_9NOCA|nr:PspC domain-containing protein [Rhodococcus xishaensis]RVW05150.1 PspC domain-containing protein [Rhodococcus xishaensis]